MAIATAEKPRAVPAPEQPDEVSVLGVPVAVTDYLHTMDWIDAMVARREKGYICAASVYPVMVCQDDPELRDAVLGSSMTVPDGQPLVWAMNALGGEHPSRVYGPNLMAHYCARSALSGTRMFLYGGRNQGALVQLTLNLRKRYPGLRIVGGYAPPYRDLTSDERRRVIEEINDSGADVVWVGIGVPKQEKWMASIRDDLETPVLIGVGAAFDFHAGLTPQAPETVQNLGLEWLFRLIQEPRRLWRRYLRYNPRFIIGFVRQFLRHRLGIPARRRGR
jgi:N-acetylglucosaminyldiphosphoundecaprenol N-acetyl-beta-D-mannosaminyltransferase